MIGMCVYGDSVPPTLESFDGQFEGLAPKPEELNLGAIAFYDTNSNYKLICNYEAKFDDIHPYKTKVEELDEDIIPK